MILIIQRISKKKANNEHASEFSSWAFISCKIGVSTAFLNINRRSISSTLHPHLSTNFEASPELISSTGFSSIQFQIKTHFRIFSMQKKNQISNFKIACFFYFQYICLPWTQTNANRSWRPSGNEMTSSSNFQLPFKLLQKYEKKLGFWFFYGQAIKRHIFEI